MEEIVLQTGRVAAMDQVREYFEYLFRIEQSGDPFPADFDTVWPLAYATKANAKRALVTSTEFYENEDYLLIQNDEQVPRQPGAGGAGSNKERILLSTQCMEFFIARKVRHVFEVYRECRVKFTEIARQQARIPYHLRRYLANHDQVPFGYFSILQELTTKLVGPLEFQGYTLPDKMVPDISMGRIFCKWLRDEKHVDPDSFPTYNHSYEDGRVVQARAYPNQLLPDFLEHFHNEMVSKPSGEVLQRERSNRACLHTEDHRGAEGGTADSGPSKCALTGYAGRGTNSRPRVHSPSHCFIADWTIARIWALTFSGRRSHAASMVALTTIRSAGGLHSCRPS
jgi:hypothetical protein